MKFMFYVLISFMMICFCGKSFAQTDNVKGQFNQMVGTTYHENFVKNPSMEYGVYGITASGGGTPTRVASDSSYGLGKFYLSWLPTAASQTLKFSVKTLPGGLANSASIRNCQASILIGTTASSVNASATATIALYAGATKIMEYPQATFTNQAMQKFIFPAIGCSRGVTDIVLTNTGTVHPTYVFDESWYSEFQTGSVIPPNTFTAKVSSAGVVIDETGGDFINGNCVVTGTSVYTCAFNPGFFTATPTVQPTMDATIGAGIGRTSATSAQMVLTAFATSTNTATANPFSVSVTKVGSDYLQQTIAAQNYDFTSTFTPVLSTGTLGTGGTQKFTYTRSGSKMLIHFDYNPSVVGTTGSGNYYLTIPGGWSIDYTGSDSSDFGGGYMYNGSSLETPIKVKYQSATQIAFRYSSSLTSMTTVSSSQIPLATSGARLSFDAVIPILGWSETQGVPQLLGSITSNASNSLRDEYVNMNLSAAGTVSVISSSSNWYTSFTASSSIITGVWPSSNWSVMPGCSFTCNNTSGAAIPLFLGVPTTTGAVLGCNVSGAYSLSSYISLRCIGPR